MLLIKINYIRTLRIQSSKLLKLIVINYSRGIFSLLRSKCNVFSMALFFLYRTLFCLLSSYLCFYFDYFLNKTKGKKKRSHSNPTQKGDPLRSTCALIQKACIIIQERVSYTGVVYVLGRGPGHRSDPVITRFTGRTRFITRGSLGRESRASTSFVANNRVQPLDFTLCRWFVARKQISQPTIPSFRPDLTIS